MNLPAKEAAASLPPTSRPPKHLLDTTMFWSETGGGVRRYLGRKRLWLRGRTAWRHTLVAPGAQGGGNVDCGGLALPFCKGYRFPLRRRHAACLIAQQAPDLIEAGDPYLLAWASLDAARELKIPAVAFCHSNLGALATRLFGPAGGSADLSRRGAEAYLRRTYAGFDLVLAPSRAMADTLRSIGVAQVEQQRLGVDTRCFHPARRDEDWRRTQAPATATRLLLYVGRFAVEKNLPTLVAAVERLGPRYLLLAVGDGPAPPRGKRVRVLPFVREENELAGIYASVDACVHAGDQETFGLSVLEALACGTPAVVRGAAGLKELVDDSCGVSVESLSVEAWAAAIDSLFDRQQEARRLAARRRAEAFDWERVLPELAARYERLLGGDAGR